MHYPISLLSAHFRILRPKGMERMESRNYTRGSISDSMLKKTCPPLHRISTSVGYEQDRHIFIFLGHSMVLLQEENLKCLNYKACATFLQSIIKDKIENLYTPFELGSLIYHSKESGNSSTVAHSFEFSPL